jgi:pimeloyl-ACP methyl ester carboxylesterase
MASTDKPTIVLVHGAFADASGWAGVIAELRQLGYPCYAPANPLRRVTPDGDYIRSFAATVDGPVVLVGHSYGGCVITNAGVGSPNVKALVYIAAFAPEQGEKLLDTFSLGGAHQLVVGRVGCEHRCETGEQTCRRHDHRGTPVVRDRAPGPRDRTDDNRVAPADAPLNPLAGERLRPDSATAPCGVVMLARAVASAPSGVVMDTRVRGRRAPRGEPRTKQACDARGVGYGP